MPTIPPATYPTQQERPKLQMATETIVRTFTETTTQPDITHQLSQPFEEPMGGTGGSGGSFPLGTNRLNNEETRVRATLINAFRRRLQHHGRGTGGGEPPDDDDLGGGGDPSNNEPNEAGLQDHVPIPQARDIKPMGSLPRIFDGD